MPRCARAYARRRDVVGALLAVGAAAALRAGISTFGLSRYMGTSLTMIDRYYGRLGRDGPEHAIRLLDGIGDSWARGISAG